MTKEEQWIKESIENYIFAYTGKRAKISDADAQHFTASVMSYLNLCTPSLPSNLDEAAEESARSWRKNPDGTESRELFFQPHIRGFKAGAEWMAGQEFTMGVTFRISDDENPFVNFEDHKGSKEQSMKFFKDGDKVIVQIRKK